MHTPEQKALLSIQQIDLDITKLQRAIEEHDARKQIAAVRAQVAQADALLERLTQERATVNSQYVDAQLEVDTLQAKLTEERKRMGTGIGHREAGHLQREIDTMVRRIDALEYGEVGLLDKRDELDGKVAALSAKRDEFAAAEADLSDRFRTLASHAQARIAQLNKQRGQFAERVPADVLERYGTLSANHGGIGLGELNGDACSACQMVLATTQLISLRSGGPFGTCPQCHRLLLVPQSDGDEG